MSILISTIYKGNATIQIIKEFKPDKIYFIVSDPLEDKGAAEIRQHSIEMIKDFYPDIKIVQIPVKMYDIVDIASKTIETIQKEDGSKIIIHISEGRKTLGLGLLFGSYAMKEKVDSAYYVTEESNTLIRLPIIEMRVPQKKWNILRIISSGKESVAELEKELKTSPATIYVHLKELRDDGFLNQNNKLTEMGKIVLLNNNK